MYDCRIVEILLLPGTCMLPFYVQPECPGRIATGEHFMLSSSMRTTDPLLVALPSAALKHPASSRRRIQMLSH